MTYPKMIIFDYGHTLLYEPDWNTDVAKTSYDVVCFWIATVKNIAFLSYLITILFALLINLSKNVNIDLAHGKILYLCFANID